MKERILDLLNKYDTSSTIYKEIQDYYEQAQVNYQSLQKSKSRGVSTEHWLSNSLNDLEPNLSQQTLSQLNMDTWTELLESGLHIKSQEEMSLQVLHNANNREEFLEKAFQTDLYSTQDTEVKSLLVATILSQSKEKDVSLLDYLAVVDRVYNEQKIAYQVEKKIMRATDAIDAMIDSYAVQIKTMVQLTARKVGGDLGAKAGMIIGQVFGPPGVAIGNTVGRVLGEWAGQSVSQVIQKGVNRVTDLVKKTVSKISEGIKSFIPLFTR